MSRTAYDLWLKFIARPSSESGLTFPTAEARAIMAIPMAMGDWRRYKRDINKAARQARKALKEAKDASTA